MHELSIASSIIDSLKVKFQDERLQITEINLQVGKLTCLLPESLQFCFDSLRQDKLVKNATLKIETINGTGFCQECNEKYPMEALYTVCPKCQTPGMEIVQGNELKIKSVEVEDV